MRNGDEDSPCIILAGLALLMKMLIFHEPCGSFGSKKNYLCIFTLSSMQNNDEASLSIIWSVKLGK